MSTNINFDKKLGIPSKVNKWCNRDMKLEVLTKYANSVFGRGNYSVAVGLRIDEMDRVRKDYKENNVFYPLMDHSINQKERNKFWKDQPIQITIPGYKGNCDLLEANNGMTFYRDYNTIEDLVKMAQKPFTRATDEYIYKSDLFDQEDECGSGCNVF